MKRVMHYRNYYLPLSETFIYSNLVNFRRIEAFVVSRRRIDNNAFPFPRIYSTSPNSKILTGMFELLLRRTGVEWLRIRQIARIIEREKPQLVHAHFGPDACDLLDVPSIANLPLVCSFYGYDASELANKPSWRAKYERLFGRGKAFIVEGGCMRQKLMSLGCPEEKTKLVRIGVNPAAYRFTERKEHPGPVRLLFCGRFVEKKGLLLGLKAINLLGLTPRDIEFRVIGDGDLKPQILKYVSDNGMTEMVRLLGYQPHDMVKDEIEKCDIMFQPSVTARSGDSEGGAPTVLLEAQAAGAPVVSTTHADIPEIVLNGVSGYLAKEGDVHDIADKLAMMLADRKQWPKMGQAGRTHVEEEHDIMNLVEQIEDVYFEVLDGMR